MTSVALVLIAIIAAIYSWRTGRVQAVYAAMTGQSTLKGGS